MKKVIIATLLFTMLHSCMGCSDSQSDMEPIPVPQEEYMASDMVIYEANPRIFAEENAFSAIKAELDRIQSLGTTVLWLMPVNVAVNIELIFVTTPLTAMGISLP